MSKRHVFLTGEKQVGKTTIIRGFLSRSGLSADGFITFWESYGESGGGLYLAPFLTDSINEEKYLVAVKGEQKQGPSENMLNVFNTRGREILDNSGRRDIIVMDELGFIESEAAAFRRSVMRHIAGGVPILGVIKPMHTEFLDEIRAHPEVEVRMVTAENRKMTLDWLREMNWGNG